MLLHYWKEGKTEGEAKLQVKEDIISVSIFCVQRLLVSLCYPVSAYLSKGTLVLTKVPVHLAESYILQPTFQLDVAS